MYCVPGTGSNLNAGTATGPATYSGVGDSDGTQTFTPSDGSTPASTVSVGMYASIYVTSGATVCVFVGRITDVAAGVNGAITVSTTAKVGTIPAASAGAHTITCKVGGAWAGPSGATIFPFAFIGGTLTDASGNTPRVNFKAGTYSPTASMAHNVAGPCQFEGYTTTPGDGGRAVFDGANPGTSFVILNNTGNLNTFEYLTFQNNGTGGTGAAACVVSSGSSVGFRQCCANNARGNGFQVGGAACVECEAFNCNVGNTVNLAGFDINTASGTCERCYSHGNTGSNTAGFSCVTSGGTMAHCVADGNTYGYNLVGAGPYTLFGCDSYNNTSHGVVMGSANTPLTVYIENGNHCNNGGWGIFGTGPGTKSGWVINCGFGSGTAQNTSGQTSGLGTIKIAGLITLPANLLPWNAPATGDFRVTLSQCKGVGQGGYLETSPKAGTIAYPDVGAAQSQCVGGNVPTTYKWSAGWTSRGNVMSTELNSLASAGVSALGSVEIDNTANLDQWAQVQLNVTGAAPFTAGDYVNVYMVTAPDGSNYEASANNLLVQRLVVSIPLLASGAAQRINSKPFSLEPSKCKFFLESRTASVAFGSSGNTLALFTANDGSF
jgi:hypothetical protein